MHIKNIHCMVEKLAECAKCEVEKGIEQLNTEEMGEVTDMIKDLCEAEYYARIAKRMEKSEEEDEAEEKYIRKMLKEENKDEYKRMREEYGEDEGERRFYDNYRYKSSGRFAPRGKGTYSPRRGYEEPPYYHMNPDMMREHDPEYWRDVDRAQGRLYFSSPMSGNMSGGNTSGNSGNSGNTSEGGTRSYTEGYNDGNRRGYEEGMRDGRNQGGNSRYERAKRGYEETKEKHKGNTPEDKQLTMREAEKVLNVVFDEIDEMLQDATPEMKNMVKTKTMTRMQKIQ